jgi:Abortive infection alpha
MSEVEPENLPEESGAFGEMKDLAKSAKSFLDKLIGPPLEEVGGLMADQVKFFRFKQQVKIINKAQETIKKSGIEPGKISLKTLVPILENGSLEEDDSMTDRWSGLLATAAKKGGEEIVRPCFAEILKELSPTEAVVLDGIYDMIQKVGIPREEWDSRGGTSDTLKKHLGLSDLEYALSIDNLFRLRLCSMPSTNMAFLDDPSLKFQVTTKNIVCITELGYQFVTACRSHT